MQDSVCGLFGWWDTIAKLIGFKRVITCLASSSSFHGNGCTPVPAPVSSVTSNYVYGWEFPQHAHTFMTCTIHYQC